MTTVINKDGIEFDIDALATDVNGKLDRDCLNYSNTGYSFMAGAGMPSNTYEELTLGASGTTYNAPANGYYFLNKVAGSDWYYIRIAKDGYYDIYDSDYRTTPLTILFPVKKGDVVTVYYNATGVTNSFRFIYAEGSESEAQ